VSKGKLFNLNHVGVGLCEHCIFRKWKNVNLFKPNKTSKIKRL